jgi:inosine-uridine nucleoside N-ribohydrolase
VGYEMDTLVGSPRRSRRPGYGSRGPVRAGSVGLSAAALWIASLLLASPAGAAAGQLAASGQGGVPSLIAAASGPTPLIIDSDLWSNADDVGALATAFALQIKGEDQVIAITLNTRTDRPSVARNTWRCAAAIAQYYNSGSVPMGADMPDMGAQVGSPDFITPCAALASPSTPNPGSALSVLRQALVGQADGSVAIAEIGYQENLQALLNSPPDAISTLSGHDLIAQKVKELVIMGGGYPNYPGENNLVGNPGAAADVAAHWPTKIVWSGIEVGNSVTAGSSLDTAQPANSPVRVAFDAYGGPHNSINLYDPTAVYHAVRPGDALLTESLPGQNVVNLSNGSNAFTFGSGNQSYLNLTNAGSMDSTLESLLDVLPSGASPPPPPPPVPSDLTPPTVSGSLSQGQTLTESHGSWANSPTGYSYQWEDCDTSGNNCSPMAGRRDRAICSAPLTLARRSGWSRPRRIPRGWGALSPRRKRPS